MTTTQSKTLSQVDPESLADRFRAAMGNIITPVAVVTSIDSLGSHGTTVSAFASLSMDPPMVLVSLDHRSTLLEIVRATGLFGLNVLGSGQSEIANVFARKGRDKFDGIDWRLDHGAPRLAGVMSYVSCQADQIIAGGDHDVIFGRVLTADSSLDMPLSYHSRSFGTHRPH